jgi:hypothetical protein
VQVANAGKDVGEKEPSYTVGGNVNKYNHYGKQYAGSSKKIKNTPAMIQQYCF